MEEQIVKTLAERAMATQLPVETAKPLPTVPAEPTGPRLPDSAPPDPLLLYRLADFFSVGQGDREDGDIQARMLAIFDWAKQKTGSDDHLVGMEAIRQLETQLGLTFRNDEKLNSLYRWIKLDRQRQQVEREMSLV